MRPQGPPTEQARRPMEEPRAYNRDASSWERSVDATRSKRSAPSAEQIYTGPYVPDRLQASERRWAEQRGERQPLKRGDRYSNNSRNGYGY